MTTRRTLLGIHPSMMNELTEEWSRPFRMRLGEKYQDGTRDIEFEPVDTETEEANLAAEIGWDGATTAAQRAEEERNERDN